MRLTSVFSSLLLMVLIPSCATGPTTLREADAKPEAVKLAAAKDCNEDSFCTREYLPTTCQFSGQSFEGSNPCEAKKLARRYACEKDMKLVEADVACKSKPAAEELPAAAPAKKGKGK